MQSKCVEKRVSNMKKKIYIYNKKKGDIIVKENIMVKKKIYY